MKINMEKLNQLEKAVPIPNTEKSKYPQGFFGFFEPRNGYNKLVAYGPNDEDLKFTWIHREYVKWEPTGINISWQ